MMFYHLGKPFSSSGDEVGDIYVVGQGDEVRGESDDSERDKDMDEGEGDNDEEPIDEVLPSSSGLRPGPRKDKGLMGGMRNIVSRITGPDLKEPIRPFLRQRYRKKGKACFLGANSAH